MVYQLSMFILSIALTIGSLRSEYVQPILINNQSTETTKQEDEAMNHEKQSGYRSWLWDLIYSLFRKPVTDVKSHNIDDAPTPINTSGLGRKRGIGPKT